MRRLSAGLRQRNDGTPPASRSTLINRLLALLSGLALPPLCILLAGHGAGAAVLSQGTFFSACRGRIRTTCLRWRWGESFRGIERVEDRSGASRLGGAIWSKVERQPQAHAVRLGRLERSVQWCTECRPAARGPRPAETLPRLAAWAGLARGCKGSGGKCMNSIQYPGSSSSNHESCDRKSSLSPIIRPAKLAQNDWS
jgi:hypothetical protein